MHIFGRPDSHLSCCHQQCADRTEEKQTHNPLKLRQFLFTGPVFGNTHLQHHMSFVGLFIHLTKQSINHLMETMLRAQKGNQQLAKCF